jgi:4-hydroxy-tetrahydrodipicolinate reductase
MDYLPTVLTAVCQRVQRVRVTRVQDASTRRTPFQQKIGAGLTLAQFRAEAAAGSLRHVGLPESIHMIAHRLGWRLSRTIESLEPVIADRRILSGFMPIEPGAARGVHQIGRGLVDDTEVITLDFLAAVGEPEAYDRVEITGEPDVNSTIAGGINGDLATCAIVLNALEAIRVAPPGLRTMLDMPLVAWKAPPPKL